SFAWRLRSCGLRSFLYDRCDRGDQYDRCDRGDQIGRSGRFGDDFGIWPSRADGVGMHLSGVENERNSPISEALRDRSDTVAPELNIENRGCEVFALRQSKRVLQGV